MDGFEEMMLRMRDGKGFIAALDQSGGSTPKTLKQYGVLEEDYADEKEMFDRVHEMRTRIITNPAFDGKRILGAILFVDTMERSIMGEPTPSYLWNGKRIVPFVKVDEGLDSPKQSVQLMKPMPHLHVLLRKAKEAKVFGTKMRSVIHEADTNGIEAVVEQQFDLAESIIKVGLVPIIEPEVSIKSPQKAGAEQLLKLSIENHLKRLSAESRVIFKLTPPSEPDFYRSLLDDERVVRVVALSGGYSRDEALKHLADNHGVIASFSRALLEDLRASQSDKEFTETLEKGVSDIYEASLT